MKDRLIAELREQLAQSERLRRTDPLTGLLNRAAWDESEQPPIVSIVDLDGLKWLNDTHGYGAGDCLLCLLATCTRQLGLTAYRVGGDEFIVCFGTVAEARLAMPRLAAALASAVLQFRDAEGVSQTMTGCSLSFGVGHTIGEATSRMHAQRASQVALGQRNRRGDRPRGIREVKDYA